MNPPNALTTNKLPTVVKVLATDNDELCDELESVRKENERIRGELESTRDRTGSDRITSAYLAFRQGMNSIGGSSQRLR